jgi:hypothetical protein
MRGPRSHRISAGRFAASNLCRTDGITTVIRNVFRLTFEKADEAVARFTDGIASKRP